MEKCKLTQATVDTSNSLKGVTHLQPQLAVSEIEGTFSVGASGILTIFGIPEAPSVPTAFYMPYIGQNYGWVSIEKVEKTR